MSRGSRPPWWCASTWRLAPAVPSPGRKQHYPTRGTRSSWRARWPDAPGVQRGGALHAFGGPGPLAAGRSLVLQRAPDRGFSPSADGRGHGEGWDGVSALDAYFALRPMVWAAPEVAAEAVRGVWQAQSPAGS